MVSPLLSVSEPSWTMKLLGKALLPHTQLFGGIAAGFSSHEHAHIDEAELVLAAADACDALRLRVQDAGQSVKQRRA